MKKFILMTCALVTVSAQASVKGVKCKLEGTVSLAGKETKILDTSIAGHVTDDEFISFNDSDPNFAHVRVVKLQGSQTFKYAIEGIDRGNGLGTIVIRTFRNTSPTSETTAYFRMPQGQKKFAGISGASQEKAKDSHLYKLSCEWIH